MAKKFKFISVDGSQYAVWVIGMISGLLLMIIGIYAIINGVVDMKDWYTQSLGIIIIVIGFYAVRRCSVELLQNTVDDNQ